MGIPLHRIKDIRVLYEAGAWDITPIDFEKQAVVLPFSCDCVTITCLLLI